MMLQRGKGLAGPILLVGVGAVLGSARTAIPRPCAQRSGSFILLNIRVDTTFMQPLLSCVGCPGDALKGIFDNHRAVERALKGADIAKYPLKRAGACSMRASH